MLFVFKEWRSLVYDVKKKLKAAAVRVSILRILLTVSRYYCLSLLIMGVACTFIQRVSLFCSSVILSPSLDISLTHSLIVPRFLHMTVRVRLMVRGQA